MKGFRRDVRPEAGPLINERIVYKYRDIRVVGADGSQIGIMQSRAAHTMAKEQGLDLVMVSATANPPVCKIIDYGRHKYETDKLSKDKKSKQQEVKGINISPRIASHDLETQTKKVIKFLTDGAKVRVVCRFKAREVTHPELGRQKLDMVAQMAAEYGTVERPPAMDNRLMIMVMLPKPSTGKKSNAKVEDKQDGSEAV